MWEGLDAQMRPFLPRLIEDIGVTDDVAKKLATSIAADVRFLSLEDKTSIKKASPVPLRDRLAELRAFQGWMEHAGAIRGNPFVTRAQVLTQNYVCFVYLPESCFRVLAKVASSGSATRKCAQFLTNNPVRAFRNSIAHANWMYRNDFGAIVYWARKGNDSNEPLSRFEVGQGELRFWQALSRCVAYAGLSNL